MKRLRSRFFAAQDGTSMVEFALAFPLILSLAAGTIEFAMVSVSTSLLEAGLREASRYGITGLDEASGTRETRIMEIVNEHSAGLFTVSATDVSSKVYQDFSNVGDPEPFTDIDGNGTYDAGEPYTDVNCNGSWDSDMGVAGAGAGNEVVLYTVTHDIDTLTGLLDWIIAPNGKVRLQASVAVRNEPFPGGVGVCSGP